MNQSGTRCLWLLGPARVDFLEKAQFQSQQYTEDKIPRFRSRRTIGLLGYLAAEQRPVARDLLAALFWPDEPCSKGRANLSRELHNLARILPGCWESHRQRVTFIPSVDTFVDLYQLLKLISQECWGEAADLLSGEFMEGLILDHNPEFEIWLLAERERWRSYSEEILRHLIEGHTRRGQYTDALQQSQRLLQLSAWDEGAHRNVMRLLAWTGQRGAALRQFENCKRVLSEELDVEPALETIALYQEIQAGKLDLPPQLPAFLTDERARHEFEKPLFVGRESELGQLDVFIDRAIAGQGRVIFISGSPGWGKTALLETFSQRAMEMFPNLLVASGSCNAYSGIGDPYLPYRDVMGMLTGDVEARWDVGAITRDHARRLWDAFSTVIQVLLDDGPHLLDVFVQSEALLSRSIAAGDNNARWPPRLRKLINQKSMGSKDVEQGYLFQQVTDFLVHLSNKHPLLLILDDFQWADAASISLLFHLGRRLPDAESRLLIACAYRPEEVSMGRAGERHPLAKVLFEFKRTFGDIWVDLGRTENAKNRRFVNALLDVERNRLSESFRDALFSRTGGNPLFTIELLRAMRDRGELLIDSDGAWIAGSTLDWEVLPARVEAAIEERIDRLDPELQEILSIASVEGEVFTARILAEVRNVPERSILDRLSQEIERRHRLVIEQEEVNTGHNRMSRYRFNHILFQDYLYKRLGKGERRLLHGAIAAAQEKLYKGQLDEMAVQLANHYYQADDHAHAFHYFSRAAENAQRVYANDEAYTHYTRAIEVAESVSLDVASLAKLHRGRGLACERLGEFEEARADHEAILQITRPAGERCAEWRALLDLGKLWASRDYDLARDYFERALELAQRMDDPAVLAGSLNWIGNWHANAEDPLKAVEYHQAALEIVGELGDRRDLANTLDLLGLAHVLGGDLTASVRTYDQAIALSRELDDRPRLVSGLIARAVVVSELVLLASVPAIAPPDAQRDFGEAIRIAREIDSASDEAWAHWALGLLHIVQGCYGQALEVSQHGLEIASQIGHREWIVGNRCALGGLYLELLAPEEARQQFESALTLADELRSQYWIHHATSTLAAAYCLLDDRTQAHMLLDSVLSTEMPMDSLAQRSCWARRAELALYEGDLAVALDITDRLITSAPGKEAGGVITFLWKLKGEALAGMGHMEEAQTLLQAAIENAQATKERFLLWRLHASMGRMYRALGRQSEAEKEFSMARELVEELADTVPTGKLRDEFLQRAHERLKSSR